MTVEQLIKALSKFPKRAKVAVMDHDHTGTEEGDGLSWSGAVSEVCDAPEGVKVRGYAVVIRT